jgi:hypothetical protein
MTVREFGASAPITRSRFATQRCDRASVVRAAWLLARFIRREAVFYDLYKARFRASAHAFRRDLCAVRDARIYRGTELLGGNV